MNKQKKSPNTNEQQVLWLRRTSMRCDGTTRFRQITFCSLLPLIAQRRFPFHLTRDAASITAGRKIYCLCVSVLNFSLLCCQNNARSMAYKFWSKHPMFITKTNTCTRTNKSNEPKLHQLIVHIVYTEISHPSIRKYVQNTSCLWNSAQISQWRLSGINRFCSRGRRRRKDAYIWCDVIFSIGLASIRIVDQSHKHDCRHPNNVQQRDLCVREDLYFATMRSLWRVHWFDAVCIFHSVDAASDLARRWWKQRARTVWGGMRRGRRAKKRPTKSQEVLVKGAKERMDAKESTTSSICNSSHQGTTITSRQFVWIRGKQCIKFTRS